MNGSNNNANNTSTINTNAGTQTISWLTKAKYVATGVVVGVIVAPLVRDLIAKVKPKIDAAFDDWTGTTESYVERASDLLFRAKEHVHKHGDHVHEKPKAKPSVKVPHKETELEAN